MKIFLYCQHVLGVGHFFRALEICRALKGHDVVLVTGGSPVDAALPDHVREIRLPPLMMDKGFKGIYSPDRQSSVAQVKEERKAFLQRCFREEKPHVLIVELYPFGRKAFRFELDPVLEDIKNGKLPPCKVVCSLRDILVEKDDAEAYENRVIKTLNRCFDALLIHSDPGLLRLDQTFSRMDRIKIPIHYTGFVAPLPDEAAVGRIGQEWMSRSLSQGPGTSQKRVIASAGGGSVGKELLMATVQAVAGMEDSRIHLKVFSGPFMEDDAFDYIKGFESKHIEVSRFSRDFLNHIAASHLSISMAGYNTCMNILAARVPSIVWPFAQNREQRLRAELLAGKHPIQVLSDQDLTPETLAGIIHGMLKVAPRDIKKIDLSGARTSAEIVHALMG